jgi:glycerol-3-phosphate acyltransferase PlsY
MLSIESLPFFFLLLFFSYLIGSISFGLLITKALRLGDIRSIGSGNTGATNVLRTGNKTAALLTLVLDASKGALVVYFSLHYYDMFSTSCAAITVFLGHLFPLWQKFKGGKGVATLLGIILVFSFKAGMLTCLIWLLMAIIFKKSSFSALSSFLLVPLWLWVFDTSYFILPSLIMISLTYLKHKENIKRLFMGTELDIKF